MGTRIKGRFESKAKVNRLINLSVLPDSKENQLLLGRRIVEFDVLFENLKACSRCNQRLNILDSVNEVIHGLGSVIGVKCLKCEMINKVPTGKRHSAISRQEGPRKCFDVNTKLAAAMLNAGVGETQVNNMLAELNLPTVHHSTLKRREREIGSTMETVAEDLCSQAIDEEKACLAFTHDDRTPNGHSLPAVSSDGGWQRRGTGNNYNSLSGHVTMVGQSTGKCLSFAVAKKCCRICKSSQRKGKRAKSHSCRKNWNGSSKAMEPHLTVKCLNKVLDKGLAVKTILMDDDTSTFSRVKRSLLPDLVKCSDKNHIVKNMTNELYRVKHKKKDLSVSIINYLKKNFKYALAQNKNDTEGMRKNISAIVPHSYGDHTLCNPSWCRSFKEGSKYKHNTLPNGNDLTAVDLKTDLQNMFDSYTGEKMVEKLATAASTNSNENLNHIISRKAPKAQHFSGSESLDYRISAAVSQKNDGHGYIVKVNTSHCLSPGRYTEKRVSALDKQKARNFNRQKSTTEKKRRLELKEERSSSDFTREVHEGKTYQSGIETSEVGDADIEVIPPPLSSTRRYEYSEESGSRDYIVFDLETTGLATDSSIIQVAAQHLTQGDSFSCYILPASSHIPRTVSKLTGIEIHGNVMFHNNLPVTAVSLHRGLQMFSQWLDKFCGPVLVAHNAQFDARILMNTCQSQSFSLNIYGFACSLKLFREKHPELTSHKQEFIAKELLKQDYNAHDAVSDVHMLAKLLVKITDVTEQLKVFTAQNVVLKLEQKRNEKAYIDSYEFLMHNKHISKSNSKTLASSGLHADHLRLTYDRYGTDALTALLKERVKNYKKLSRSLSLFYEIR